MRTGIALGSNIEPRFAYLRAARRRIDFLHAGPDPVLCSKVYETSPVECPPGSPFFLNAVLELFIREEPYDIFQKLQSIEQALGRRPSATRNSPRVIDIDLLYCEDIVIATPGLTLPPPPNSGTVFSSFARSPISDQSWSSRPFPEQWKNSFGNSAPQSTPLVYCDSIY